MQDFILAKPGSTGTGTFTPIPGGLERVNRIAVVVTPTGGTSVVFTVEGLLPDGVTWAAVALVPADATAAASPAAVTANSGAATVRYVAGLDTRFFRGLRINVSANTATSFAATAAGLPD